MKRKEFLKWSTPVFLLLANGKITRANESLDELFKKKKKLRFAIGSDAHYGQAKTDYNIFLKTFVEKVNKAHGVEPFDFCMLNGDIIHNDPVHYLPAKGVIDQLAMKYYVTPGNHDMVTADEWEKIWNSPVNYDFKVNGIVFLAATTSNEKGEYICPNLVWMQQKLEEHKEAKTVFIVIHINPAKITKYGIDCPDFLALISKYKNVRAVFNGHDHDEDTIKTVKDIHFVFDAHIGGDWGTVYKGFRVVEMLEDNSIVTYILNPDIKINNATL